MLQSKMRPGYQRKIMAAKAKFLGSKKMVEDLA